MEVCLMQLWICGCWLLPIAAELALRRWVPLLAEWQVAYLYIHYFCNRLLLAPAYSGYYAACRQLAAARAKSASCAYAPHNLHTLWTDTTLLQRFFSAYRHPVLALKKQLQWDAVRVLTYAACLFPALVLLAFGGREQNGVGQMLCTVSGILFGLCGVCAAWVTVQRMWLARICDKPLLSGFRLTRGKGRCNAWLSVCARATLFAWLPFSDKKILLYAGGIGRTYLKSDSRAKKPRRIAFHTRIT